MMEKTIGLSRDFIIHPGETLQEVLEDRNMSQKELAMRTGVSEKHVSKVINGLASISVSFAKKLEYVLGIDASFWVNLQTNYNQELQEYEEVNKINKDELAIIKVISGIIEYFANTQRIEIPSSPQGLVIEARRLLGVSNLTLIPKLSYQAAYRASVACEVDVYVLFAWQRICELLAAQVDVHEKLDIEKLIKSIPEIKQVMFMDASHMQQRLTEIFANCGVAFRIVKNFKGAPVHGFIERDKDGKNILCMTIRQAFADIFWFTLFHEIGHFINDDIKQRRFDFVIEDSEEEELANKFASDVLLNPSSYADFVKANDFSLEAIKEFAKSQDVRNFIVIGRLQKEKILAYSEFSEEKIRYKWA